MVIRNYQKSFGGVEIQRGVRSAVDTRDLRCAQVLLQVQLIALAQEIKLTSPLDGEIWARARDGRGAQEREVVRSGLAHDVERDVGMELREGLGQRRSRHC